MGSALLLHVPSPTGLLGKEDVHVHHYETRGKPWSRPPRGKCSVLPSSFCLQGKPFYVIFLAPQTSGFYGTKP